LSAGLALLVVGFLATGCATYRGAVTPVKGEVAKDGSLPGIPLPPPSSHCVAWAACCADSYAAMVDAGAISMRLGEEMRLVCFSLLDLPAPADLDDTCTQMLESMLVTVQGLTSIPGYRIPATCRELTGASPP